MSLDKHDLEPDFFAIDWSEKRMDGFLEVYNKMNEADLE